MAIYRIFPQKDATIYTEFNTLNSGIDPILDLSKYRSNTYPSYSTAARILTQFDLDDINFASNTYFDGGHPDFYYLGMTIADATPIPLNYSLYAFAISGAWDMGTGRQFNVPATTNGVSWKYKTADMTPWSTGSFTGQATASYFSGNPGGGNWYTNTQCTQSFDNLSNKDVYMDVTTIFDAFFISSKENDGIIVMNDPKIEFDVNYQYKLNFFSRDTNTIYPSHLDLYFNDVSYQPSTSSMPTISSTNMVVSLGNNKSEYNEGSVQRFNINVRDQYPQRTFVTSSLYTVGKYLPVSSSYCLRDLDTDNIIFDFDPVYTAISADAESSFFILYMNGLEPERYYKLQIMVVMSGSTQIFDNDYNFKVTKNTV